MTWKYEFLSCVKNNVLLAALVRKILFLPLETEQIHMFVPPFNVLFLFSLHRFWINICRGISDGPPGII